MMMEHWESWDYDCDASPSLDGNDRGNADEHEHEQALIQVTIGNFTAMLEKEDDSRHMFAASMFGWAKEDDDLSVDSNRTVRRSNRVEITGAHASSASVTSKVQVALTQERRTDIKVEPKYNKSSPSDHRRQCASFLIKKNQVRRGSWPCIDAPNERLHRQRYIRERNGYEARAA